MKIITFTHEFLAGDRYHELLHRGWIFYTNANNTNIDYFSDREGYITWTIVILLSDIINVKMITIISNDANKSAPLWKG